MAQSFFKLDKSWYDGKLWTIPSDYQKLRFGDSELLKIYDGGDFIIAAVSNYPFYLHAQNPVFFAGYLCGLY